MLLANRWPLALPSALALALLTGCPPRSSSSYQPYQPYPPYPQQPQQQPQQPWPGSPWGFPPPVALDNAQRCVDAINQRRYTLRLPALQRWPFGEMCTSQEAQTAAQTGQPHAAFGRCGEHAQNVCPAWQGPVDKMLDPCIESEWQEGPGFDYMAHGHYLNMTSTRYTKVFCGFYTAPNGSVWAVQNFQ